MITIMTMTMEMMVAHGCLREGTESSDSLACSCILCDHKDITTNCWNLFLRWVQRISASMQSVRDVYSTYSWASSLLAKQFTSSCRPWFKNVVCLSYLIIRHLCYGDKVQQHQSGLMSRRHWPPTVKLRTHRSERHQATELHLLLEW